MRNLLVCLLVVFCSSPIASAMKGQILKDQVFESAVLGEPVFYNLYLPEGYDEKRVYPVIYNLHWFGGDHHSANEFMEDIDRRISQGLFPEVIIVAPDAKICWYIDDYKGEYKYSSMFTREFLPFLNKHYALSTKPGQRVIMGASMGGFGALRFAMLYPEQFGVCVSFMGGMSTREQIVMDNDDDYVIYHQNLYGDNLKGKDRDNDWFREANPLYIAQRTDPEILKQIHWYIQTCDNDYHSLPNVELHAVFHKLGVVHEFRVMDGNHDGDCVNASMEEAIGFIRKSVQYSK